MLVRLVLTHFQLDFSIVICVLTVVEQNLFLGARYSNKINSLKQPITLVIHVKCDVASNKYCSLKCAQSLSEDNSIIVVDQ